MHAQVLLLIAAGVVAKWQQVAAVRPALRFDSVFGPPRSKQDLRNTLSNVSVWFSEAGIEYTTIFGTALTLHRDGDVKDGDDDVDLIMSPANALRAWYLLWRHGVPMSYHDVPGGFMQFNAGADWAPLDIYVDRGDAAMVADRWDGQAFPRSTIHPPVLKKFTWGAREFQIPLPANADEFASLAYGEGWKQPSDEKSGGGATQNLRLASDALAQQAMAVVWFALSMAIICIFRNRGVQDGLGLTDPATTAVFFGYVGLFLATSFLTRSIRGSGPGPVTLVWAVCGVKALASMLLYRVQDAACQQQRGAIPPVPTWWTPWTGKYVGLALIFVVSDVLRLDFIQKAGPSAFHVLINFRVFFCMWIWQWLMQKQLHMSHWAGITVICAGCILKEIPSLSSDDARRDGSVAVFVELLALLLLGSVSMVYNEKLLKTANLPTNYQNIVLYTSGFVFISIGAAAASWHLGTTCAMLLAELRLLMQATVVLQVAVFAMLGIVTSHFLRLLSSVTKEVAAGVEVILSIPLDAMLFGAPFGLSELAAGALVLMGVLAFASQPMAEVPSKPAAHKCTS
eukprot:gb/GFBE01068975.1/.p1 GENE.gb/GFBE01068975.1/~~gb/GFBE01068975.1/.p1  ORF type:complete len:568 (+),score=84.00 gb/GFBE01068975.1/:1-1704(+)